MKVTVKIGNAMVSTNIVEITEVWDLIIPTMMASGYSFEDATDSLYDWMENSHSEFLAEQKESTAGRVSACDPNDFEEWGKEYDEGYLDGYNGEPRAKDSKAYLTGFEDGDNAFQEESGSESESENKSLCGND